ncbi:cell envelope integrity protein TolA, partial [Mesorhizobium sp. M8A.F.Ca.ET.021.01.1.1]
MKRRFAVFAALALFANCNGALSQEHPCRSTDPIDTIKEMSDAIYACWRPPPGTAGMSLTLRFSLRRNGTLIGKPRATYSDLGTDSQLGRAFVASILKALDDDLPLPFSDGMGGA